jgi:hypothetical protein
MEWPKLWYHEASEQAMNGNAKDRSLPAHPFEVLDQLVMTYRVLAAIVYTTKKTTACRVPRVL